jgi:TPR repeat protein
MYIFKLQEAQIAIDEYLRKHPNSTVARKARDGDCAAMLELYKRLKRGYDIEVGPSYDACMIISEAASRKYTPAMIESAQDEMCVGAEYWPDGLGILWKAYSLGDKNALIILQNEWHNCAKDIDVRYRSNERIDKYEEFILAFFYLHGIETDKNDALAFRLFQSSAKHGCLEAHNMLIDLMNSNNK